MLLGRPLLGAASLAGGSYICAVAVALAPTYKLRVQSCPETPPDFKASPAFALVNPRKHKGNTEAVWTAIRVPPGSPLAGLSDGQIVARFLRGFFYGAVISPERFLVDKVYGRDIAHIEHPDAASASASAVNFHSSSSLPADSPPPVHSKLWGAFQVLDSGPQGPTVGAPSIGTSTARAGGAFVDLGFGLSGPRSTFAGVNRFAVLRQKDDTGDDAASAGGQTITISYLAHACNPSEDRPLSAVLFAFHQVYARLLFRNGLAAVLGGL
ncbi:hypothetical protein RB595_000014 [Gaeumannomyces hyphopodioides]